MALVPRRRRNNAIPKCRGPAGNRTLGAFHPTLTPCLVHQRLKILDSRGNNARFGFFMRSFGRERTGFLNAHVASRVYVAVAARIVRMRM